MFFMADTLTRSRQSHKPAVLRGRKGEEGQRGKGEKGKRRRGEKEKRRKGEKEKGGGRVG
jgi:hypothetical protein